MSGGGGGSSDGSAPANGGEFLLKLLQRPPHHPPSQPQLTLPSQDPAVAALGPSVPVALGPLPPWVHNTPPHFAPHNFFVQNPNVNSVPVFNSPSPPPGFIQGFKQQHSVQFGHNSLIDDVKNLGLMEPNHVPSLSQQQEQKGLVFGSLRGNECIINGNTSENFLTAEQLKGKVRIPLPKEGREVNLGSNRRLNGLEVENQQNPVDFGRERRGNFILSQVHERSGSKITDALNYGREGNNGHNNSTMPPPGFSGKQMSSLNREFANRRNFEQTDERVRNNSVAARYQSEKNEREKERRFVAKNERLNGDKWVTDPFDCPAPLPGNNIHSVSASDIEESMMELHREDSDRGETTGIGMRQKMMDDHKGHSDLDDLEEQLADSLGLEDELGEGSNNNKPRSNRDKVMSLLCI